MPSQNPLPPPDELISATIAYIDSLGKEHAKLLEGLAGRASTEKEIALDLLIRLQTQVSISFCRKLQDMANKARLSIST